MPLAKETKTFDPAPAGTHIARCYGCISLGTQHSEIFADAFKVMLMFELPMELIQMDGKDIPMTVSKEYTLSLGKKSNLRKHLDAWRGRAFTEEELAGFEVSKVVGAPCQLTIVHVISGKGSAYAKIESITGLARSMKAPDQVHPSVKFEVEEGRNPVFLALPEWIRKKIEACDEWLHPKVAQETLADAEAATQESGDSDDIPF